MAALLSSYCAYGLSVFPVQLEVHSTPGMPSFSIIGMAGTSVQEAKDRVRSALLSSGFTFPLTRKVVNLAPAEISKQGSHFDLSMALGLLISSKQMAALPENIWVTGELGLDGALRPVKGLLSALLFAREQGIHTAIVPETNLKEACLVEGLTLYGAKNLREVVGHFSGKQLPLAEETWDWKPSSLSLDFSDIAGQVAAKRALMVAAAGGHHILMNGPPGSGKTMLAEAFLSLLPPLSFEEFLEVLRIYSVAGLPELVSLERPFRRVHSKSTVYTLLGGGIELSPGEISLAHQGVLFMDEFPEFAREALEALREPLESKSFLLRHGKRVSQFPCQFQLIATMNPCPCGYFGDQAKACHCSAHDLARYRRKLSGPLMDRLDLSIHVPRIDYKDLRGDAAESSSSLRDRVREARERQAARLHPYGLHINRDLTPKLLKMESLDLKTEDFLQSAVKHHALSGRAIHRILKVARTLADLEACDRIACEHLAEALQYRLLH